VYVGLVVGLNYRDPRFEPFEAFQQFKHHPLLRAMLDGGELLGYGARTIAAGGWQSLPRMEMPGALLIGDAAGVLNLPKAKGVHQAIRCGALAAEHVAATGTTAGFDALWRASPGGQELRRVRNFKPGFKRGLGLGLANAAVEIASGGHVPWTLANGADAPTLERLSARRSPERRWLPARNLAPRDREAAVFAAGTHHDEAQPAHLRIADLRLCVERCTSEFGNPCLRFCPASVYEIADDGNGSRRLQVNAANCVHCKACDIKDPYGNITWVPPEGGSGPNYTNL
jgi:electron-transferring-flavoprotein dehydrogenase